MAITYVEVRDTVVTPTGDPASGYVVFVPNGPVHNGATMQAAVAVRAVYDANGEAKASLAAGDDTDTRPEGLAYTVLRRVKDLDGKYVDQTFDIEVSAADATAGIDLAEQPAITLQKTGTITGRLVIDRNNATSGYPIGLSGAVESLSVLSSFDGGEDEGEDGQFDSTGRLNLYSYQRADVGSYGETIRHFAMRKDSKQMEAWYFPASGYDANRDATGSFKPVVWAGAHWEANNHASNHKHWSVETPDSTGAIQTRFEIRWGDPTVDDAISGLDKTLIATNLADFNVRCTNGQELRLSSPNGEEKKLVFSRDAEGDPQWRRWALRSTSESETGSNVGSNFQLARYDDSGTFVDNPVVVSRATGNVTLAQGVVARRSTATASSISLNSTSLGSGVGVIAIGNAETVPSGTPSGGGVLYVQDGALKYKGSSGTVTTIAEA